MNRCVAIAFVLGMVACTSPRHLGYDYGRAYTQAVNAQGDLTRPSIAGLEHPLGGVEAQAIRLAVQAATTDEETGESTLKAGTQ